MPTSAQCPACGNTLQASRHLAGKPGKCPKCSATVNFPKTPTVEEEHGFTGEPDSASATKKPFPVVNVTIMASSPPPTGTINVPCPTCGTVLKARASAAGRTARCSSCGGLLTVPEHRTKVDGTKEYGPADAPRSSSAAGAKPSRTINVACPACGKTLRAPASAAGKKAKCPQCGKPVLVPVAAPQAETVATPVSTTPPGTPAAETISAACPACGKTLKAPASAAGKKAKCPACNAVMVVPEKILDAEELATSQAMGGTPLPIGFPQPSGVEYPQTPVTGIPQVSAIGSPQMPALGAPQVPGVGFPQPAPSIYNDDDFSPAGSPTYGVTASAPTSAEPERIACPKCGELIVRGAAKCRYCKAIFDESLRRTAGKKKTGSSGSKTPTVRSGLLAMVLAVVWFVAGWFCGYIFFYPPILFVIGLVTFFRGLAKSASERD
ncbi:MAG: hypothetical protein ACLQNE_32440 [Thermoguttaceae bacterium]